MSTQAQTSVDTSTQVEEQGIYERLCALADLPPLMDPVDIRNFHDPGEMARTDANQRITAGLQVFF